MESCRTCLPIGRLRGDFLSALPAETAVQGGKLNPHAHAISIS